MLSVAHQHFCGSISTLRKKTSRQNQDNTAKAQWLMFTYILCFLKVLCCFLQGSGGRFTAGKVCTEDATTQLHAILCILCILCTFRAVKQRAKLLHGM